MKYKTNEQKRRMQAMIERVGECERCGRKERLTIDHIVPVEMLLQMGLTKEETFDEENFAVLCYPCNALKGNKLDFADKRTKANLLKYLDLL